MPATLSADTPVAALLLENPGRAAILEAYRIDYCCAGQRPLSEACARRGVSVDEVLHQLAACDEDAPGETGDDWSEATCADLISNILAQHHTFVRLELPRLSELSRKVALAHGDRAPNMHRLASVVQLLRDELESHMEKEEEVLFPMILAMEHGREAPGLPPFSTAVSCMEEEHAVAGEALEEIRRLTANYELPSGACNTWRVFYHTLAALEQDLHIHIHKENNILFPRALDMEKPLRAKVPAE